LASCVVSGVLGDNVIATHPNTKKFKVAPHAGKHRSHCYAGKRAKLDPYIFQ
jgi:hypothetical protein